MFDKLQYTRWDDRILFNPENAKEAVKEILKNKYSIVFFEPFILQETDGKRLFVAIGSPVPIQQEREITFEQLISVVDFLREEYGNEVLIYIDYK